MKATARPSPSAITQALVPYPPRDRPSASRVSRSADEPPFERHRLLSGGPGCWCRPETSSRAGHHAPGPGAAAAPTRPGAPSGGRSAPPATRDQAQPGWRATWPRSDAARRWPTACAAGPEAGSCPWAGIPRSAAPASSSVRLSASLLLPSQEEQNARNPIQFKREQALVTFGAFMILEDVQQLIWGTAPYSAGDVVSRLGTTEVFSITYTNYQLLFIPAVALAIYGALQFFLRGTRVGRQIVAVTHNAEVATALGIHARRIRLVTFIVGAILGALGGALAAPTTSLVPGVGGDMIVLSFSVVATAGLGQITGALAAAVMIGLARSFAVYTVPELEVVVPYLIMVGVLLIRPHGLFTVAQARRI